MDKQKKRRMVGSGLLMAMLALGCDAGDAEVDGPVELRPGSGAGGVWLNTNAIGSTAFSELDLKGNLHDGVRLVKVSVKSGGKWQVLDGIDWHNGQARGKRGGTVYVGQAMLGSKWELKMLVGGVEKPTTMTIAEVEEAEPGEFRYVFQYTDVYGVVKNVCAADPSGDVAVVPIQDITVDDVTGVIAPRPDTLYLACTSGAVGKAVAWGYKPWQRAQGDFEAAVRMVRADYCYDGTSWTTPGAPVEVRDVWDINDFLNVEHPTEAVWGRDALGCLGQTRSALFPRALVTCGGVALPACSEGADLSSYDGALFWVKNDPQ